MKTLAFDSAVIGGGAAGMAAALKLSEEGFSAVLIDREACLGGILNQCIHPGFGMHRFGEDLTGPEYAGRDIGMLTETKVKALTGTTVTDIRDLAGEKELVCYSAAEGVVFVRARTVVLAMGCRERNRGNIRISGTRPAGVFTAGFAQRLVNIEGLVPGRNVVILGSGDIGLIMARRMHWIGCRVLAVIEIQPYPSGLTRNIVQCLNDYDIPLYLSHLITGISGKNRIESVTVTPLKEGLPDESGSFVLPCDTLLLSVGLIPENELTKKAGAVLDSGTGGPLVDSRLMTTIPGIFACGNVLHVHDLVDYASDEAGRAGTAAARYM
ncbi:MAG: FAD-binding protein, partial [Spirochaetales bacterium]